MKLTQDNTDGDIIVVSGQTVTYKATVTNTGKVDVKDVTVEGTLPSGHLDLKALCLHLAVRDLDHVCVLLTLFYINGILCGNTGKVDVKDVTVEGTLPSGLAYGSTESGSVHVFHVHVFIIVRDLNLNGKHLAVLLTARRSRGLYP